MTPTVRPIGPIARAAAALAAARTAWRRMSGLAAAALMLMTVALSPVQAEGVRGSAAISKQQPGDFARMLITLTEDVESDVRISGSILIVRFKRPIDVPVGKLADQLPEFISSARADPDGRALRFALARRVRINAMTAGERLYVDLLPENWVGAPPGLPQEVVQELAERARKAEKLLRQQRKDTEVRKRLPTRVKASAMPTFVRYVFELPEGAAVSTDLGRDKLTLVFGADANFDLADAKVLAPSNVSAITQINEQERTVVEFGLIGDVNVHSFREEGSFIVDIGFQGADRKSVADALADAARKIKENEGKTRAENGGPQPLKVDTPKSDAPNPDPPSNDAPRSDSSKAAPAKPVTEAIPNDVSAKALEASLAEGRLADAKPEKAPPKPEARPAPPRPSEVVSGPSVAPAPAPVVAPGAASVVAPGTASGAAASPSPPAMSNLEVEARIAANLPNAPTLTAPQQAVEQAAHRDTVRSQDERLKAEAEAAVAASETHGGPESAVPTPMPVPAAAPSPSAAPQKTVKVDAYRNSEGFFLNFGFHQPTAAAVFRRGEFLWFVFDSTAPFDLDAVRSQNNMVARDAESMPLPDGVAVRVRLERPQLISTQLNGTNWVVTLGDQLSNPAQPLTVTRNIAEASRANITIPTEHPSRRHRIVDPAVGDAIDVITLGVPVRSFITAQNFIEFRLLETVHGIAIQPFSDDVGLEITPDKVMIGRPGGLTLSAAESAPQRATTAIRPVFDANLWKENQTAPFVERLYDLQREAALSKEDKRVAARLALARFYMANELYHEAKAVLEMAAREMPAGAEDIGVLVSQVVASILTGDLADAAKGMNNPAIGTNYDMQLWRALLSARQGKWADARERFKTVEFAISALPLELQRIVVIEALRSALEVRDYATASSRLNELDVIGLNDSTRGPVAVLRGRLAEALGREVDAFAAYQQAAQSGSRQSEFEGRLRLAALKIKRNEMKSQEARDELETLAVAWRGDAIEVETLQLVSKLAAQEDRFRDALAAVKTASLMTPQSPRVRDMQEEAVRWFEELFLGGKADLIPPIEAVGLFYEHRELTPIGRRGDEMIRRLADRLASIDLLDQASELLQYQVDHRLEGAARAQVAARLATFYLMNRKPERAVATLRDTRVAELAGELRQQRLLLEARAQSDLGRHDLALDIIANIPGPEAVRLRSDIYWGARRWRESSEQIELLYGERWRDFQPLSANEKADIIRAGIGYALAEDTIGLERLREKYAARMTSTADKAAFDLATTPVAATSAEFGQIAKLAATVDTLDGFLRAMKARYSETSRASQATPLRSNPLAQDRSRERQSAISAERFHPDMAEPVTTGSVARKGRADGVGKAARQKPHR